MEATIEAVVALCPKCSSNALKTLNQTCQPSSENDPDSRSRYITLYECAECGTAFVEAR